MPRPYKTRWISFNPLVQFFLPQPAAPAHLYNQVILGVDELEALKLADFDGLSQEQAARKMNISRATFGRIISGARNKVAMALVYGKGIRLQDAADGMGGPGGHYRWRRGPHRHGKGPWR
ncbi:MAG: DUF134 domain-containing protein [Spirochaetota bacterium]